MNNSESINVERDFLMWLCGMAMESFCNQGCSFQCPFYKSRNPKNVSCKKLTESDIIEIFYKWYYR